MWNIAKFEMAYLLRRPATYIYFAILFAFAFLFMTTDIVQIGGGIGKVNLNSPFVIFQATAILGVLGTLITTALAGTAIIRDFQYKSHELFYTKPITKAQYLGGRFFGVIVVMVLAYLGISLGLMLGELMPWLEADKLGTFNAATYWNSLLVFILPNVIFMSALFFAVGTLTRNIFLVYVQGIILLIAQTIAQTLIGDLENEKLSALLDPFGLQAFSQTTKYWTVVEQNLLQLSFFDEMIFTNRLFWIGISVGLFVLTYVLFDFNVQPIGSRKGKKKSSSKEEEPEISAHHLTLPTVHVNFNTAARWSQYKSLVRFYFKSIVTEIPFLAIAAIGILNFIMSAIYADSIFGTSTWPVTYIMTETVGSFVLFAIIIITVYAGELINRERELKLDQTFDALNLPNAVSLLGKYTALVLGVCLLFLLLIPVGMVVQLAKGFTEIEPMLYLSDFVITQIPNILSLSAIAFLIHALINNKFMGHFGVVAYFVLTIVIDQIGLEHNLFSYGSAISITYSDMNGWGPFLGAKFYWDVHWIFVAGLFLVFAHLLWVRGTETSLKARLSLAKQRIDGNTLKVGGLFLFLMTISGTWIFYNTNVKNDFYTSDQLDEIRANFEKKYKSYESLPIPKIIDTYIELDLYPSTLGYHAKGRNILTNKSTVPIDSVWLNWEGDYTYNTLAFDVDAVEAYRNEDFEFSVYHFNPPIQPGDTLTLSYEFEYAIDGFSNSGVPTSIAGNGTFLNASIIPSIGYNSGLELNDDSDRKEQGLEPKERVASLYDSTAYDVHGLGAQADWINFETIVSTDIGQTAIAPGYLQEQWTKDNRAYFHYKMDAPILYFFSFLSAEYTLAEEMWNDVKLQIFHHPSHTYNIDRMMESLKHSLDYFTEAFGPYQYKQLRILEFPRYASFAQSFPNTVPFSEGIGFIARLKEDDDVDYPYYVTSHELAHQWFGHQIVGADVQGSTMLIESFSQYAALMVMKQQYGEELMKKFLSYELNSYLRGRTSERKKELPLMMVENQQYIHYRKGSLVMYALQDYLGEGLVNNVIKEFVAEHRFEEAPYTTTLAFVTKLREATPDSMKYLVEDLFETITLYENRVTEATVKALADSTWEVQLAFDSKKLRADSLGLEQEMAFNDYIDIGVFGAVKDPANDLGNRMYLEKHRISQGADTIRIIVHEKPNKAGIDPYNKLVDRNPDDNVKKVEETE